MSLDFAHFEIYYVHYSSKFTKAADALVLFVHWSMIQNRFKCLNDTQMHHTLPINWLSNDNFYDLQYKKHDINYRLEIYIANDCALIQLKNMENLMDSSQYVKIDDFINLDKFESDKQFSNVYKDLPRLYMSIKWSIDRFRSKRSEKCQEASSKGAESAETISISDSSSHTQLSKKNRKESTKNFSLVFDILSNKLAKCDQKTAREINTKLCTATYADFVKHIKQEKAEFETNVEIYRRSSVSSSRSNEVVSSASSNNLTEVGNQKMRKNAKKSRASLRKTNAGEEGSQSEADSLRPKINPEDRDNVERDKINRDLLFDYNPITNYFNYNNKTDSKSIDQKLIEEDQFVKKAYEKFNLKAFCQVKLVDCFSSDLFRGLKVPIKLDDRMKQALQLDEENEDDQYDDIEEDKKKKKPRKVRKNIWREKRRAKPNKKKVELKKKTSKEDVSILEKSADLVNFFKNGTLKRKRSNSNVSNELPNLSDTEPSASIEVTNLEEKEEESSYKSPVKQTSLNDSVAKKLTFSATVQSSITVKRIENTLDDPLSINLFADEDSQPPSKRTRRDSGEELVDLDKSIEQNETTESEIRIESPWINTPKSKSKSRLTPKSTPMRTIVAKSACTPKTIGSKLREIGNRAQEVFEECLSPGKFYKNFTSTQINETNGTSEEAKLETLDKSITAANLDTINNEECKMIEIF